MPVTRQGCGVVAIRGAVQRKLERTGGGGQRQDQVGARSHGRGTACRGDVGQLRQSPGAGRDAEGHGRVAAPSARATQTERRGRRGRVGGDSVRSNGGRVHVERAPSDGFASEGQSRWQRQHHITGGR